MHNQLIRQVRGRYSAQGQTPRFRSISRAVNATLETLEHRCHLAADPIPAIVPPAAAWSFDETTGTATDTSGNGRTARLGTGATRVTGNVGTRAISVNNTVNGVATVTGPVVNTANSFTVSAWVKLNAVGGFQTVTSISGTTVSGFYLQLRGDTGTFAFTRLASDANSATAVAAASTPPTAGTWYHLVGVDDVATGTLSLYIDGHLESTASYTGGWQANGNTQIGQALWNGGAVDFVNGSIDEVSYYASALSAAQVAALDTPAAWSLNDGTGTTAVDVSGNSRTLTLGSGATWTAGRIGSNALSFNGASTGVASVNSAVLNTARPFSVSAWVRLDNTNGYQTFASIDGAQTSGFYLQLRGVSGKFAFTRLGSDSNSATPYHADAAFTPQTGKWYNLIGVNDVANGRLLLYVNGSLQGSVAYTAGWQATGATVIGAGKYAGARTDFVSGSVDDVRFYNSPLSAESAGYIGTNGTTIVTVDTTSPGITVSPDLFSAFMEDINYGGEGGVYNDQIRNSGFNDSTNALNAWTAVADSGVIDALASDATTGPTAQLTKSGKLTITSGVSATRRAGIANGGYFGVAVKPSTAYSISFYAKATSNFTGPLTVSLESTGGVIYASAVVRSISNGWAKYAVTLTTAATAPVSSGNRIVLSTTSTAANGATLWFGAVHAFPPSYKGATTNHLRPDLMEKLAAMKPATFRVPGGNYLEGNYYADRFKWYETIGKLENRPGHFNSAWGYWSSDGMGLDEYLQMAEEIGSRPILAVYAGYSLRGDSSTGAQLTTDVQDAINELHYVLDPVTTSWGAMRAANGHPAPYDVREVEVGNEDFFSSTYSARYPLFYDAIRAAFPQLKIIASDVNTGGRPYDILDEHYYNSPAWFQNSFDFYTNRSRASPKVMVGEYAANQGNPTNNMASALGDATFMLGTMKNSDLVTMAMYAPIWANVNGIQWAPDLIGFDASTSYGSPTYYAQAMLASNHGQTVVSSSLSGATGLRTLTTRTGNTYYVTLINTAAAARTTTINLSGVTNVGPNGTIISMSAASSSETNSITDPTHIVPLTSTVYDLASAFTRQLPANSITILKITASNGTADTVAPVLTDAQSVKTVRDIERAVSLPISGTPGVEFRSGGVTRLVLNFNEPVFLSPGFALTTSSGTAVASANGTQLVIALSGTTNGRVLTLGLNGVGDSNANYANYSVKVGILFADSNGDGSVNFNDFLMLQNAFGSVAGSSSTADRSDLNGDGVVDFNDFLALQNAFGQSLLN
jgi:alpha-L-arabinofuranosidase